MEVKCTAKGDHLCGNFLEPLNPKSLNSKWIWNPSSLESTPRALPGSGIGYQSASSMCYSLCPKLAPVLSTVILCATFLTITSQNNPSQPLTASCGTSSHTAASSATVLLAPCRAIFWFFCYNWRIWLGTVLTMNFVQNFLWDSSH